MSCSGLVRLEFITWCGSNPLACWISVSSLQYQTKTNYPDNSAAHLSRHRPRKPRLRPKRLALQKRHQLNTNIGAKKNSFFISGSLSHFRFNGNIMVILGVTTYITFFFVMYLRFQKQGIPVTVNTKFNSFAIGEKVIRPKF